MKRVVSCKRKTHHLTSTWKKQLGSGRTLDGANKENEINSMQEIQQEIFDMDAWESKNVNNNHMGGKTCSEETDCFALSEVRKSAQAVMDSVMTFSLLCK